MDTDKVIQDLNRRFAAPLPEFYQRRIIFWYDEDKEFEDKLDEVVLENAKVIALTGNNAFSVKKLLLVDDLTTNYLVYSPEYAAKNLIRLCFFQAANCRHNSHVQLRRSCRNFISEWLHREDIQQLYDVARYVEDEARLHQRFEKLTVDDLVGTECFPCINEVILTKLMTEISDHIIDVDTITSTVEKRRACAWYEPSVLYAVVTLPCQIL